MDESYRQQKIALFREQVAAAEGGKERAEFDYKLAEAEVAHFTSLQKEGEISLNALHTAATRRNEAKMRLQDVQETYQSAWIKLTTALEL